MRILADECCQADVIAALRKAGHDVVSVRETSPGIADQDVVALANETDRILLTEDLDSGDLAVRRWASEGGRAVISVAHRLSTAREADRVIVMDRGRIVEEGSPEVLVDRGGRFAALVELEEAGWDWRAAE